MNAVTLICVAGTGWGDWLRDQLAERGWIAADLIRHSDEQISSSQTTRWLNKGQSPTFESVRAVCTVLGVRVIDGLLAAGLLSPEDIGATVITRPRTLTETPNRELAAEFVRRLTEVVRDKPGESDDSGHNVAELDQAVQPQGREGEQWAARRRPNI